MHHAPIRFVLSWHGLALFLMAMIPVPATFSASAPFTRVNAGVLTTRPASTIPAAWGDLDGDGWLDLFVGYLDRPYSVHLNNRDGTFREIPLANSSSGDPHSAVWFDLDNDGHEDLFVANIYDDFANYLYRNVGGTNLTRLNAASAGSIVGDRAFSVSIAAGDFDKDGLVDLFVANGALVVNQPDFLYRNEGQGRFSAVRNLSMTKAALASTSARWVDIEGDGDLDLFITHSDNQGNTLFRNDGAAGFVDVSQESGLGDRGDSVGATFGDLDGDGYPDLLVTNLNLGSGATTNFLYHNNADGTFRRITDSLPAVEPGHYMSAACVDFDNDGWLDFLVTYNGGKGTPSGVKLYRNTGGGSFERINEGPLVTGGADCAGAACGDYDHNGFPDVLVCQGAFTTQTNALYRNDGNSNSWLRIKCIGVTSNRDAIGARIRAKARIHGIDRWQTREIGAGSGWLAFNSLESTIGFGDAAIVDTLLVEWPSGKLQEFHDLAVRQSLTIIESLKLVLAPSAPGVAELAVSGPRGQKYRAESSPDLRSWSDYATLESTNVDGTASRTVHFEDPRRFFRVRPD